MSYRSALLSAVAIAALFVCPADLVAQSPNPAIVFVDSGIKVMNADGTNVRTVVALGRNDWVAGPSWSPDGQQLAFCGKRGTARGIWKVNLDGTGVQFLATQAGIVPSNTDWSRVPAPDGRAKVAFRSTGVGGNFDLFVVNTDGTGRQNLTNSLEDEGAPSWTRDGTGLLAGMIEPTFYVRLHVLGALPLGGLAVLATPEQLTGWILDECQFANGSDLMMFRGGPQTGNQFPNSIWIVDTTAVPWTPTMVYGDGQLQRAPSFSPNDGRIVLRHLGSGQTAGIFTANPNGTSPVRIRSTGTEPSWKHN